jgi:pyruvate/2-oxoglutarate dehydrogenase complex dihydrolipoamide acyltransferase (E2) component
MNGLAVCSIFGLVFYVLFYNWELLKIFLCVFSVYLALTYWYYPYNSRYNTVRKKVGINTWADPYGPEAYSTIKVRFSKALAYLDHLNRSQTSHITPTHLVAKATAEVLAKYPELNRKLVFGCVVPYETVDVSILVALDAGSDLGYLCFREADKKPLTGIAAEAGSRVNSVRSGEERKQHRKTTLPIKLLPTCIGAVVLEVGSWLSVALGLDLAALGIKRHPCGAAMITNIGTMGAELVYAPFPTVCRVAVIFVMLTIREEIVVEEGEMKIDKVLTLAATVDSRFVDAGKAIEAQNMLVRILEDPATYLKE